MSIGALIQKRRKELGLTQEEVAKRTGLAQSAISRFESDLQGVTPLQCIASLLEALELDPSRVEELFTPSKKRRK